METEYKYLLHLLGAYLREEEPETCPDVNWEKLLELAGIHSVIGILGYLTMCYPICPDPKIAATLRNFCKRSVLSCGLSRIACFAPHRWVKLPCGKNK